MIVFFFLVNKNNCVNINMDKMLFYFVVLLFVRHNNFTCNLTGHNVLSCCQFLVTGQLRPLQAIFYSRKDPTFKSTVDQDVY